MSFEEAQVLVEPVWAKFIEAGILNMSHKVKQKLIANKADAEAKESAHLLCGVFDEGVVFMNKAIQKTMAPEFMKSSYYEDFKKMRFPMPTRRSFTKVGTTLQKKQNDQTTKQSTGCIIL